jgi:dihydrofolate reductase
MIISLIAAASTNRVIGINGDLPWRLPADLKFFKSKTLGHHILMGRKTWESLGKPLPDRISLVVSRQKLDLPEGVFGFKTVEEAIQFAENQNETELMVIGGGEIYAQTLPLAHQIYLTHVYTQLKNGTAFFPPVLQSQWQITESAFFPGDEKNGFAMDFLKLERRRENL